MVIQRNWKATPADALQQNSSSEDSNGSWQMPAPAGSGGSYNRTLQIQNNNMNTNANRSTVATRQTAHNVLLAMHQRFGGRMFFPLNNFQQNSELVAGANKSLEILRQNIQASVSREINQVIRKYVELYFVPAVTNIRENLGEDVVTDENVQTVCIAMLEEAKLQYRYPRKIHHSPTSRASSPQCDLSDSESSNSLGMHSRYINSANALQSIKRKESDTESEASLPITNKKSKIRSTSRGHLINSSQSPSRLSIKKEGYKWDPTRLGSDTLFIMGSRANRILGLGTSRGRLYAKHPDLVRYPADVADKEWLAQNNLMPLMGGKTYVMVLEDIQDLATSDEYKNNPNVMLSELRGFRAPDFMLKKIQIFVNENRTDVSTLLPNALDFFDSDNTSSMSMTPPSITGLDSGPSTPSDGVMVSEVTSLNTRGGFGHLPQLSPSSTSLLSASGGSVSIRQCKSLLSSSHATLTALLSSHGEVSQESGG